MLKQLNKKNNTNKISSKTLLNEYFRNTMIISFSF